MWGIPVKDGFVLVIVIDSIYRLVGAHYVNACLLKHKNTHFLVRWCIILSIRLSDYLKWIDQLIEGTMYNFLSILINAVSNSGWQI